MKQLEHPDITAALKTGRPSSFTRYNPVDVRIAYCDNCGGALFADELVVEFDDRCLCESCFRKELAALPLEELAEMVEAEVKTANEVSEYG